MASAAAPGALEEQPLLSVVRVFAQQHYFASGAQQFGVNEDALARLLVEVLNTSGQETTTQSIEEFLQSIRLQDLVLARTCADGNEYAWELFLTRYRSTLYETAYKVAKEESSARALADSLYAELYGVDSKGQQRPSKLRYYHGRGSLQGWLRTIVAQEYVNRYRTFKRETSLDSELEEGAQFPAPESEMPVTDERVDAAVRTELAALSSEERFMIVSYYLERRTLAEIAKLLRVHESTISRKLDRLTAALRKRIGKRLIAAGMGRRQSEEIMAEVDVRDLHVNVNETLRQGGLSATFYKQKGESQG